MTQTRLEAAGKTHPGRVRTNNEDSLAVDPEIGLLVVADGMGGHNSGEVASALATETMLGWARKFASGEARLPVPGSGAPERPSRVRQMERMIGLANSAIYEKSRRGSRDEGMGTTVAAGLIGEGMLAVGHVGDSRLYLFRNGRLEALTQDHSLVMDQVSRGMITAEEARASSFQNILTRALGTESEVEADVAERPLAGGDVILLCTDGLTKMVPEPDILRALKEGGAPLVVCDRLIRMANDAGGADNVTVVAARVSQEGAGKARGLFHKFFTASRRNT